MNNSFFINKKFLFLGFLLISGLFILGPTILTIVYGITAGNILSFIAGLFLISLYFIYPKLPVRLLKRIKTLLLCGIIIIFAGIFFIFMKGLKNTTTFNENVVLLLGCSIRGETLLKTSQQRCDACLNYMQQNPNAIIIVSGGKGEKEDISEAEAMKRYLVAKGINSKQIVKEDQSRNTRQNMLFSREILYRYFPSGCTTVCITSDFHAYRASILADYCGLNTTSYNTKTAWYLYPSALCREILAFGKMHIEFFLDKIRKIK
jgi:uncharacterized SAM-binding protein YcdF (DUF218 family)